MDKDKIMLIDDSSMMLKAYQGMLATLNEVEIVCFSNPVEAMESLKEDCPSIVITDYEMPELTGLEVLKQIRNHETSKDIPVVILTSNDDDSSTLECLREGADDYIIKRANPEVFIAKVNNFLKLASYQKMKAETGKLETFKATVASLNHEFNNIIQMVDSYLELAERKENTTELRTKLETVMYRLVDKIKAFKKVDKIEFEDYTEETKMLKTE